MKFKNKIKILVKGLWITIPPEVTVYRSNGEISFWYSDCEKEDTMRYEVRRNGEEYYEVYDNKLECILHEYIHMAIAESMARFYEYRDTESDLLDTQ